MRTFEKPRWRLEIKTGDQPPHVEWLEMRGYGLRYRYVEREEAEQVLAKFQQTQPGAVFRITPL